MIPFQVYQDARGALYMCEGNVISINATASVVIGSLGGGLAVPGFNGRDELQALAGMGAVYVGGDESGYVDVTADATTTPLVLGRYYVTDLFTFDYAGPSGWTGAFTTSGSAYIKDASGNVVASSLSASTTMAATAYGKTTYNGGAAFNVYAPVIVPQWPPLDLGMSASDTTGIPSVWVRDFDLRWKDAALTGWTLDLDGTGTGAGTISDPAGFGVATRAADASKASDPTGLYTALPYGMANYSSAPVITSGAVDDGTFTDQDYADSGTVGSTHTWTGATDATLTLTLDTGTGLAQLHDATGVVAVRTTTELFTPDGSYEATTYGEAAYGNGGEPWSYAVRTSGLTPFTVGVTRRRSTSAAGYVFVVLTVNGSNQVTARSAPQFATTLPANTSTAKTIPIAHSDGAGGLFQLHTGAILWQQ